MKKFILPILLFLMFIPLYVNAETCDTDKISISSITLRDKTENVIELDEATASGRNINLNLSMVKVGDNIEYKFVVKNDSNEDYELDKTSLNLNSDYINYSFVTEDNTNIVKANSSKNVTLRIEYKNEVPEDKFKSGSYNDSKTMMVQLSNGNTINVPDTFKNPNTGVQSYILIILILLLISGSLYVLLKKKKYTKFMILVIGTTIIMPISVYALCKCDIKVESNVTIVGDLLAYTVNTNLETKIGEFIPNEVTVFKNYNEAINEFGYSLFLKHKMIDDKIGESYVGFIYKGKDYYLRGFGAVLDEEETRNKGYNVFSSFSPFYDSNKIILDNIFGEDGCWENSYVNGIKYTCLSDIIDVNVYNDGTVCVFSGDGVCCIYSNGSSECVDYS